MPTIPTIPELLAADFASQLTRLATELERFETHGATPQLVVRNIHLARLEVLGARTEMRRVLEHLAGRSAPNAIAAMRGAEDTLPAPPAEPGEAGLGRSPAVLPREVGATGKANENAWYAGTDLEKLLADDCSFRNPPAPKGGG